MGLFSETFNTMDDLLEHQLKDLYDAEHRIHDQLPDLVDAVHNPKLKTRFESYHAAGERRISRMDEMFAKLGKTAERETCEGTKGLLKEVADAIGATGDPEVRDAGLIASYQRVAHYAIAGYGSARNIARRCEQEYVGELCQQSLDEAYQLDKDLTDIAVESVNPAAVS